LARGGDGWEPWCLSASLHRVRSNERQVIDEIMDGPDVEPSVHAMALAGLRRINAVSHAARRMARPIIQTARRLKLNRLTMLDVACGGGDVSVGIVTTAAAVGIDIDLTLLDRSDIALKLATATAKHADIAVQTIRADLLDNWSAGSFDVVTCSLFLHHIRQADQVVELLGRMRSIARRQIVISDLRRCRTGLAGGVDRQQDFEPKPDRSFRCPGKRAGRLGLWAS